MSSVLVWCICSEADYHIKKLEARIAQLEALLKRADDIANWTGEDLICAGRSYASVVQAYKNDRATLKGKKDE